MLINSNRKPKAVFLDRDGTINEEMGYINHVSRLQVFGFVPKAIKILNDCGYLVFIITNQSGIARGYFTENLVQEVHSRLLKIVSEEHGKIEKIYYCPHHPTEGSDKYRLDCPCRKPKPGMIETAQKEFNIALNQSYIIGDRYKDIEFGQALGLKTILVLTGYGIGEYTYQKDTWPNQPDHICDNLLSAAEEIRRRLNP